MILSEKIFCCNTYLKFLLIFSIFNIQYSIFNSFSQVVPPASTNEDQKIEERIENIAQTADENTDFTELADNLKYFSENPINLNSTSKRELEQLDLLTDIQIENYFRHLEKHGKLISLEELQTIDGFDAATIRNILPYVELKESYSLDKQTLYKIFKDGKNFLLIRTQRNLETQKGFRPPEDSSDSHYPGNPWKYYARYRFTSGRKLSFGVTAEKDQGEEFFKGTQSSFDFYSAHLFVRDMGFIKSLAFGDYQLAYGQGLTLWTGLAFGKSPDVVNVKKNAYGISPYTSVNEVLFKRGAAISVGSKKFQADLFYSNKKFDGNLTDTLEQIEQFSSFQESGYHRTHSELADKNAVKEEFFGGHLNYKNKNLSLGFTAVRSEFDKSLAPSPQVYNTFYFIGTELTNAGFDYSYLFRNISLFGEAARSDNGSIAYVNGAMISLDPKISFSVVNRNYPREYHALYANAFRESSSNFNETGTCFGLLVRPKQSITLSGYFDAFSFPWLRYQVNAPTSGFEYLSQATYTPNKKLTMYVRYRQTTKPENASGDVTPIDAVVNRTQRNYRFDISTKISKSFTLHNRVEIVKLSKETDETGFLILQDVTYKPIGSPVSFNMRYALFDTKSYDSRLYAYENDVLYYYSIPSYYYRGSRYYITLRYKVMKGIDVWLRFSQTVYDNQKIISSGLDEIDGNKKSEVKMQVKFEL